MNFAFNKKDIEIKKIEEAKREYHKADYLNSLGYIHKSIECFENAIKLDPNNNEYKIKLREMRKERSREEYRKAISLENQKKYPDAIIHCKEAIKITDRNEGYKNKLKILKEKDEGQKEAQKYYEKALKLEKMGKLKETSKYCDKAINADPYDVKYYKTKRNCLFNIKSLFKKHYKESMQCYDKLIELEPHNCCFYSRKAECLEELGWHEEAEKYYAIAKENAKKQLNSFI